MTRSLIASWSSPTHKLQGSSVSELEEERDANLVAMLKALRKEDAAAGAFLNRLRSASDCRGDPSRVGASIELAETDFSNEQICAHRGSSGAYPRTPCMAFDAAAICWCGLD